MRILVTGATGFIGAASVRLARDRGHDVAGLARPETILRLGLRNINGLRWLGGTLAEPPWEDIGRFAPEHCLHAAWIADPGVYLDSPLNADYLRWSLAFFGGLKATGTPRAMALGTCIEYRVNGQPAREDATPLDPISPYARAKDALRRGVEEGIAGPGFGFSWGRVFYPYGPGEHPSRLCSALVRRLLAGETLRLKTPESTKDYIYIDDLAAAILAIMEGGLTGAINLGTGEGVTVRELARTIGRLLQREDLVQETSPAGDDPLYYVVADAHRLRREAGWQPTWTLEAGLRATLEAISKEGALPATLGK
jgi:nucleoside-diphosphate-sugar epimerase